MLFALRALCGSGLALIDIAADFTYKFHRFSSFFDFLWGAVPGYNRGSAGKWHFCVRCYIPIQRHEIRYAQIVDRGVSGNPGKGL